VLSHRLWRVRNPIVNRYRYSRLADWGMIVLLIAVFPANIHVSQHQELFPLPSIVRLLNLPLEGGLILWAFIYARR
jgi:uncharacterized membrane protein